MLYRVMGTKSTDKPYITLGHKYDFNDALALSQELQILGYETICEVVETARVGMDGVLHVEIDASKFPREPFVGEVETDDRRTVTFRERPDIGPDALELSCDGVTQIIDGSWKPILFPHAKEEFDKVRAALDDALERGDFEPDPDILREERDERRRTGLMLDANPFKPEEAK